MFGQQKINVQIEIGDNKLEPNILEKCLSNVNFSTTHRKYVIVNKIYFLNKKN